MQLALDAGALAVSAAGFKLKSGRTSPYFVNIGLLGGGRQAAEVAQLYAQTLIAAGLRPTTLVGAAYKGIPLAALTAAALADEEEYKNIRFAYTRKEEKKHGEGGSMIGKIESPTVIIDDILTAGTAAGRTIETIKASGAEVSGLVVALNRQERIDPKMPDSPDALGAIAGKFNIRTLAIATASDLINELADQGRQAEADAIRKHLTEYGTKN